ncbi:MAG: hypothetical protein A2287_03595 [Candidatus Melainabacteria bacterium RIFOXYA12_FULL_32_12]|nr:MAG: hypothetical protein A2104_07880 [Candidatus Melainabacteria bacterium GWF2_32_7]OGI18189.1 MAG: hypothetical protein A2255_10940 [Candidatus Melainabacteria bacterium RIFOXYA2_FULL_32_9]OGI30091.1 MAG: hypothetical protein A2287_03595 [Candidatus Melainabacteria bacterium RIFOXYA12_FULL_32_12]
MSFQFKHNKSEKIQEQRIRYILPKNDGEISNSITRNWTDQAIRCYTGGQNCSECSIAKGDYSFVCQMQNVIKILLEQVGPPDQDKVGKASA